MVTSNLSKMRDKRMFLETSSRNNIGWQMQIINKAPNDACFMHAQCIHKTYVNIEKFA